jgi:hypothetical protein
MVVQDLLAGPIAAVLRGFSSSLVLLGDSPTHQDALFSGCEEPGGDATPDSVVVHAIDGLVTALQKRGAVLGASSGPSALSRSPVFLSVVGVRGDVVTDLLPPPTGAASGSLVQEGRRAFGVYDGATAECVQGGPVGCEHSQEGRGHGGRR